MRINILFGGAAGTGPNILTHVLGEALVKLGYYVFYSRDYQSLIRGGHNFNVLTFSDQSISSNDSQIDIIVALDEKTIEIHKKNLKKGGLVLSGNDDNMFFAGKLFKILGLDFGVLDNELKALGKRYDENIKESQNGFDSDEKRIDLVEVKKADRKFNNGTQGISLGALGSGLDIYYAYPMTPATGILGELANQKGEHLVIELENEIAVANAGVGSAMTGKKVMVGTSGGGFDLMTETLSLTGIAEIPLVFYLAQRPGPATGVATYTSQGDLKMALGCGHGEFQRLVLAPGDPLECQELTNQAFYFSHKYKTPSIVISDKHLGESFYTLSGKGKIVSIKTDAKLKRYNSYEVDSEGSATENAEIIEKNVIRRMKKGREIEKESPKFQTYKVYGNKNSKNVVISWGSTKGAILDSINGLDCKFVQVLYLEPFPKEIVKELEGKNIILIENSSTGYLGDVVKKEIGIDINEKILRFDGRPFLCNELKKELERKLR